VIVQKQPKKKGAEVPPAMAERERPVSRGTRVVVNISVLRSGRHGTLRSPQLKKKAPAPSSNRHDYRHPKVEEGADAFGQVRIKIEMS
jgi:hypothetical protein